MNDKLEDSISKEEEYENLQEQLDELEEKKINIYWQQKNY